MDSLAAIFVVNGKFLGIEWHFWKVVGWAGNLIFFSRFFVQWVATEKSKRVVIPAAFWWRSLLGSLCLLSYGLSKRDSVFIFAYAFTWIPYIRNLMIAHRTTAQEMCCAKCESTTPPKARFCPDCGTALEEKNKA